MTRQRVIAVRRLSGRVAVAGHVSRDARRKGIQSRWGWDIRLAEVDMPIWQKGKREDLKKTI